MTEIECGAIWGMPCPKSGVSATQWGHHRCAEPSGHLERPTGNNQYHYCACGHSATPNATNSGPDAVPNPSKSGGAR